MSKTNRQKFVLTVSCPEANGIVRAVSDFLFQRGATISDAAQHRDPEINQFFMRVEFEEAEDDLPQCDKLNADFSEVGLQFNMEWSVYDLAVNSKVLPAVSHHTHNRTNS